MPVDNLSCWPLKKEIDMRRISHGSTTGPKAKSADEVLQELGEVANQYFFPVVEEAAEHPRFTYMFPELANDKKCLIPQSEKTLGYLSSLGKWMRDKEDDPKFDSTIPSAYTYFSQLVNHDINFTDVKKEDGITDFQFLDDSKLEPWTDQMISERVSNKRAGLLELDCVYGIMQGGVLPPRDLTNPHKMALGKVSPLKERPEGKDEYNDLVRGPMSTDLKRDRTALIGDRRNDSNIIISQLHVAFLRAHNAIIDKKKCSYGEAKQILQQHYHWLILHEFLPAIVPDSIIKIVESAPIYNASQGLPFEFSVGAFRFGHSMVRRSYYLNDLVQKDSLARFFTVVVLSENGFSPTPGKGLPNIADYRIIQWRNFLAGGKNTARAIRTEMVEPLFELLDEVNIEKLPGERRLTVQDLKRAYMMRIPTGQVIAEQLKIENPLTAADIEEVSTTDQLKVLKDSEMLQRTPLSFYVLAEAAKANNGKLGEVGGRLVAEVLIGLLRDRPDSIIGNGWKPDPDLALTPGTFFLSDLLRLAGVLEDL